jgi:hypothetical protein
MMGFVINGKFTAQRVTGVQRVASELTRALTARAAARQSRAGGAQERPAGAIRARAPSGQRRRYG